MSHPYDLPFTPPTPFVDGWEECDFMDLTGVAPDRFSIHWSEPLVPSTEGRSEGLQTIAAIMAEYERPFVATIQRYQRFFLDAIAQASDLRPPLCEQELPAEGVE